MKARAGPREHKWIVHLAEQRRREQLGERLLLEDRAVVLLVRQVLDRLRTQIAIRWSSGINQVVVRQ